MVAEVVVPYVTKRFVCVAFVENRFVEVALLATSEDEYIFVEVELVVVPYVTF